jgi:general nucleoside transport system permease protein
VSEPEGPERRTGGDYAPSPAARLDLFQRAGGIVTPLMTALLAFLIGGFAVLVTGHNPLKVYKAIFLGTGLQWLIPGVGDREVQASNLQQTLLIVTPLILTGLAVAFAFRCGMFNIGGNGQYIVGSMSAAWFGTHFAGLSGVPHVLLAMLAAALAGAAWAGIAGVLKATVGAHEVITTIMLNWIAYWIGSWAYGLGGPLQDPTQPSVPISQDIAPSSYLHVFWGDPLLQGLHIGFFIALAALVAFWFTLQRTTLGYEVRAVGFNPEAARYGGISVAKNYVLAMAISGMFAGLAGVLDMLGYQYRFGQLDVINSQIGFIGIAVALLGRNKAIGVGLSALLFAALLYGTSTRSLDPSVFPPELAGNLTLMIQALVLLFIGADVLILYVWRSRRKLIPRRGAGTPAAPQPTESS